MNFTQYKTKKLC